MPPQAAEDTYRTLQRLELVLVAAGRSAWRRMRLAALDASWAEIAAPLVTVTAAAQLAAATAAVEYVPAVLAEQGIDSEPLGEVRPAAFAGVAFDGRSLPGLLAGAVRTTKGGIARGYDGGDALALGQRWLDTALQTTVADAMRDASAASIAVRPGVSWVRMVNPPCCARCAVLAGVVYKWNRPLPRHPRCDCMFLPTTVANADSHLTDAQALFDRGLITDLTPGQRERIADGANLVRVLNESRDQWRARMAVERKAAKEAASARERARQQWGDGPATPLPPGGIQDFLAHMTSRVDAHRAMQAAGITT